LGPAIRGVVTNHGTPLAGVLVTVYDADTDASLKSVMTNATGNYSVPVTKGSYHIRFSVTSPAGLSQYYDHKTNITDALVIDASGGAVTVSSDLSNL